MKKILKVIQHICFVLLILLALSMIMFDAFDFDTARGSYISYFDVEDVNSEYKETHTFNKQFGTAVSDVIGYCGLMDQMDSNEFRESVSGNTLIGQDNNKDIYNDLGNFEDYFSSSNSNIMFFITEKTEQNTVTRSNFVSGLSVPKSNELKNRILADCDKYIYFDSLNHIYDSNTLIDESTIYSLFENSAYDFPIDTTLMVGIKKNLNGADDGFAKGNTMFGRFSEHFMLRLILLIAAGFVYFVLFIILSVNDGVVTDKETGRRSIKLNSLDGIPAEIRLLLLFGLSLLFMYFVSELLTPSFELVSFFYNQNVILTIVLVAVFALIISLLINFFWLGFLRRLKARIIWKTSLTKKLVSLISGLVFKVYDNAGSIVKVAVPLAALCLVNIIGTILAVKISPAFWFILICIDLVNGYYVFRNYLDKEQIIEVINKICQGDINAKARDDLKGDNKKLADAVNKIGESVNIAVNTSMKDEKMKADLITNVSHDLKTPLTSIINYVDLLKKEKIDNENAKSYIAILDDKSQRLKQLTDDLVEASKISSGNIVLQIEKINVKQLLSQASAEFIDKFDEKNLTFVGSAPEEEILINADSRRIYRVIENLFTNIYKYAMEGTRIYLDIILKDRKVYICVKNISRVPLNVSAEELIERFVRGDESRNSEGSGLGLSIAKNLTEAMGGSFDIFLDGDLFKVILTFDEA